MLFCPTAACWRHQMETFAALPALCEGNPPARGGFHSQKPVVRSFDVFFDPRLNRRLSNQSKHRWFSTPLRSLWRHCNGTSIMNSTWYSNLNLRWATDHLIWFDDIRPFNYTEVVECFSCCGFFVFPKIELFRTLWHSDITFRNIKRFEKLLCWIGYPSFNFVLSDDQRQSL